MCDCGLCPEATTPICPWCQEPVQGDASIDGVRYCHPDTEGVSCYVLASWSQLSDDDWSQDLLLED